MKVQSLYSRWGQQEVYSCNASLLFTSVPHKYRSCVYCNTSYPLQCRKKTTMLQPVLMYFLTPRQISLEFLNILENSLSIFVFQHFFFYLNMFTEFSLNSSVLSGVKNHSAQWTSIIEEKKTQTKKKSHPDLLLLKVTLLMSKSPLDCVF